MFCIDAIFIATCLSHSLIHSYYLFPQIVFLLRLVPLLPFNMLNYLLSVTPVNIGEYMLASWFGMMVIFMELLYFLFNCCLSFIKTIRFKKSFSSVTQHCIALIKSSLASWVLTVKDNWFNILLIQFETNSAANDICPRVYWNYSEGFIRCDAWVGWGLHNSLGKNFHRL